MFGLGKKMGVGEFSPWTHHLRGKHFLPRLGRKSERRVGREHVWWEITHLTSPYLMLLFFFSPKMLHLLFSYSLFLYFFFFFFFFLFLPKYCYCLFLFCQVSYVLSFFSFNFYFCFIRLCYVLFFPLIYYFFLLVLRA